MEKILLIKKNMKEKENEIVNDLSKIQSYNNIFKVKIL